MLRRTSLVFALSCLWCVATPSAAHASAMFDAGRNNVDFE